MSIAWLDDDISQAESGGCLFAFVCFLSGQQNPAFPDCLCPSRLSSFLASLILAPKFLVLFYQFVDS